MNHKTNSPHNDKNQSVTEVQHAAPALDEKTYRLAVSLVILAAFLSRFLWLADKPFHHDESLHAYYSQRVAMGFPHEYSALLHGPFLYHFVGLFLFLFGSTDFVARMPAALFGTLVVVCPLLLRRCWGKLPTLVLMVYLLVSPSHMYFGRFLREDVFTTVWTMGTVFWGLRFWLERKPADLYLAVAMLSFHFTNKENSYLHTALWLIALALISACSALFSRTHPPLTKQGTQSKIPPTSERENKETTLFLFLNSLSVFGVIFILLYSSFFRHPKGSLHGVLDGLYRESLLYWWEQNQKRRIDGPFDYHLPIIAHYEFVLLPFLFLAWYRVLALSRAVQNKAVVATRFFLTNGRWFTISMAMAVGCVLATAGIPRMALVPEACAYVDVCLPNAFPGATEWMGRFAKILHVSHTRHLLQILTYLVWGGLAFLAAVHVRRRFEAFLWFWLTGALGIYSHVGEKVPWLVLYILVPLALLATWEVAKLLGMPENGQTKTPELSSQPTLPPTLPATLRASWQQAENEMEKRLRKFWLKPAVIWLSLALPFTAFKALRVSFPNAANPVERLVFTQSSPEVAQLSARWKGAAATHRSKTVRIAMEGDATWPFAWYVHGFRGADFKKPSADTARYFDGIFLDYQHLEDAKNNYPDFSIYSLPLRLWWVPGQNPTWTEIFRYFFTNTIYLRHEYGPESVDNGLGHASVLYLERRNPGTVFAELPPPPLTLLHTSPQNPPLP